MGYICWINCDTCGTTINIEEPSDIIIWETQDNIQQWCDITCPNCQNTTSESISQMAETFFRGHGCKVRDFNDKFETLTEAEIDSWDIQKELNAIFP